LVTEICCGEKKGVPRTSLNAGMFTGSSADIFGCSMEDEEVVKAADRKEKASSWIRFGVTVVAAPDVAGPGPVESKGHGPQRLQWLENFNLNWIPWTMKP